MTAGAVSLPRESRAIRRMHSYPKCSGDSGDDEGSVRSFTPLPRCSAVSWDSSCAGGPVETPVKREQQRQFPDQHCHQYGLSSLSYKDRGGHNVTSLFSGDDTLYDLSSGGNSMRSSIGAAAPSTGKSSRRCASASPSPCKSSSTAATETKSEGRDTCSSLHGAIPAYVAGVASLSLQPGFPPRDPYHWHSLFKDADNSQSATSSAPPALAIHPQAVFPPPRLSLLFFTIFVLPICFILFGWAILDEFKSGRCHVSSHSSHTADQQQQQQQRMSITCKSGGISSLLLHRRPWFHTLGESSGGYRLLPDSGVHRRKSPFSILVMKPLLRRLWQSIATVLPHSDSPLVKQPQPPPAQPPSVMQRLEIFENSGVVQRALVESEASKALEAHTAEFEQRIEHVGDNVYLAIGYGLANTAIIHTDEGRILLDCLENPNQLKTVMRHFNEMVLRRPADDTSEPAPPPTLAIILSHFHTDHISGATAVYETNVTQVWAHLATKIAMENVISVVSGSTYSRSMRQFGNLLNYSDGFINSGIGRYLEFDRDTGSNLAGVVFPTHVWEGDFKELVISNETLHLYRAPGESADQIVVWLPQKRILYGADNIYRAFPNIYAIRGTPSRDTTQWIKSLELMRSFKAETLILGHSGVIRGAEQIERTLSIYRDAIQFVHDQTVRYMNRNLPLEDIVEKVQLPPIYRDHPYLQPFYGTLAWAVRAVFHHYMGWFSGEAEDLQPLAPFPKAQRMAAMVGGVPVLLEHAVLALERKEYQWSLELTTHILRLEPATSSEYSVASRIRRIALLGLAGEQMSAPARNWYLSAAKEAAPETAKEAAEQLRISSAQRRECFYSLKSAGDILRVLPTRLKAEKWLALSDEIALSVFFIDTNEKLCLHSRRGILVLSSVQCQNEDIQLYTDDLTWRRIASQEILPIKAVLQGRLWIKSRHPIWKYWPLKYIRLKMWLSILEVDT